LNRALLIAIGGVVTVLLAGAALTQFDQHRWLAAAALLALAGAVVVAAWRVLARQRSNSLRGRVQSFVDGPGAQGPARGQGAEPNLPRRSAKQAAVEAIAPEAEIAGIEPRRNHIVLGTLATGLFIGIVVSILVSSPLGLLAALAAPLVTRGVVKRRVARTRKSFEQQLPDNFDVVTSALRVGHSLIGALTVTVEAADEPSRSELGRAIADEQLGVPLDDALLRVATRMNSRDVEQLAFVTRLQREAGTNAADVIDQISENVRGRMDLERLVRTLTAQGRMARWIVSLLPVLLFGAMYLLNRAYLAPLWQTSLGKTGLVLAIIMICVGSYIIKKIVEIEV
jgi:tight adherence protein B